MHTMVLVYITINNIDQARILARNLLEKKLVACINIIPAIESLYVWDGAVVQDNEVIMIAKTLASRYDALQAAIVAQHPYQVPCILKIDAEAGTPFFGFVNRAVT